MTDDQQVILAALLQAHADGDDATVGTLEAMLDKPDEAAELVRRLGAGART